MNLLMLPNCYEIKSMLRADMLKVLYLHLRE